MKKETVISLLLLLFFTGYSYGQETRQTSLREEGERSDSIPSSTALQEMSDSIPSLRIETDSIPSTRLSREGVAAATIDTTKKFNYWRITERTGEMYTVIPDTFLTDYFHRTNVEGLGVSMAYLGNLGTPLESRIYFERENRSDFLFSDNFRYYLKQPDTYNFINAKVPYSNLSYQTAGSRANKEERLQALLTLNFGKKLNIGTSIDYLYARGFYNSQGTKHTDWVFFGNYLADRHQVHLFLNPASSYANGENGGLIDDNYIVRPELVSGQNNQTKNFPMQFDNTWNSMSGNRYYLNYRYTLGFNKITDQVDEEGNEIKQFVPVSSAIYTLDYTDKKRRFYTDDSTSVNRYYSYVDHLNPNRKKQFPSDSTSYRSIKNTLGLSLREGFSGWAKFDLTAYITHDIRQFTLMDTIPATPSDSLIFNSRTSNHYSTFVGGELVKKTGKILRYNAQGSFGVVGYNLGDFNLSGNIETRIPFLKDTASVFALGYIKNISPAYYENHYFSQYFKWDNDFNKIKKVYAGGRIKIPHTRSEVSLGVENITNYIYFDGTGHPKQYDGNIQVMALSLQQNFKLGALHWDNQVVYQTSSNQDILPLPAISAYSSLFIQFVVSKVLKVQMGANAHYWTRYYSPAYEPAIQQFRLQNENHDRVKTGEYPLLSGFLNCHLKQTRFFLQYYNLGAMFISPPQYFSIPHYPVNPPLLKMGVSIDFYN